MMMMMMYNTKHQKETKRRGDFDGRLRDNHRNVTRENRLKKGVSIVSLLRYIIIIQLQ